MDTYTCDTLPSLLEAVKQLDGGGGGGGVTWHFELKSEVQLDLKVPNVSTFHFRGGGGGLVAGSFTVVSSRKLVSLRFFISNTGGCKLEATVLCCHLLTSHTCHNVCKSSSRRMQNSLVAH